MSRLHPASPSIPHRRSPSPIAVAAALHRSAAIAASLTIAVAGAPRGADAQEPRPPLAAVGAHSPDSAAAPRGGGGGVPLVVVLPFDFAVPLPTESPRGVDRTPRPMPYPPRPGLGVWPMGLPLYRLAARPPRMERAPAVSRGEAAGDDVRSTVGAGVADLLVERLVAAGGFHVLDRRWLDEHRRVLPAAADSSTPDSAAVVGSRRGRAAAWPRYAIEGSVTRFGVEEDNALGGLGTLARLGGFGVRRPKTTVTLVARVVDERTGEVIATARGEGRSRRGAGVTLGGIVNGGGGLVSFGSKSFRESALGQATDRAVDGLARQLVERRAGLADRE